MMPKNIFDEVFDVFGPYFNTERNVVATEVSRTDDATSVEIVAPGLTKNEITVSVVDDRLTVDVASKKCNFKKSWPVRDYHDVDKTTVKYDAGIITIKVPYKSKSPSNKKIFEVT